MYRTYTPDYNTLYGWSMKSAMRFFVLELGAYLQLKNLLRKVYSIVYVCKTQQVKFAFFKFQIRQLLLSRVVVNVNNYFNTSL